MSGDLVMLHCSSCGAPIRQSATNCDHCRAEITLEQRDLDRLCDGCGARMSSRARFCMKCGRASDLQVVTPLPKSTACPRCRGELRARDLGRDEGGVGVVECAKCAGLWLSATVLDHLCSRAESSTVASRHLQLGSIPQQVLRIQPVVYLPCPGCDDRMVRRNFGGTSGVIVDLCRHHGVWLDPTELEKVLAFVSAGGLDREKERQKKDAAAEELRRRDRESWLMTPIQPGSGLVKDDSFAGGLADLIADLFF